MSISLREVYSEMDYMNIAMLAGEDRLDVPVKWFNIAENEVQAAALKEHELAIVTGVEIDCGGKLSELVKIIAGKKAVGIIVVCGPYMKEVPPETAEVCRQYNIALFKTEGSSMADVMQLLCRKLMTAANKEAELSSAVKHAIYFPQQKDLYIPFFEKHHLSVMAAYCVAILDVADEAARTVMPEHSEAMFAEVKAGLSRFAGKAAAVSFENRILILFNEVNIKRIKDVMLEVADVCRRWVDDSQHVYMAVGSLENQLDLIHRSYLRAHDVLRLEKLRGSKEVMFDELGFYKLLLSIDDRGIIKKFDQETLKPLVIYDDKNNTDYVSVLSCYLRTGGSLKETAAALFVHRNTVNYKIHKIEEILGCNLSDADERLKYTIAFKIRDIL